MRVAASLIAAFIVCFCNPAFAQTWTEYRPAGAGFRVELPGEPRVKNEPIDTDAGPVPSTTAIVEVGTTMAFVVMYSNYTQEQLPGRSTDQILDSVRDGSARKKILRSEQKLTIGGHPARRLVIDAENGMVVVSQFVLVGMQLYQVIFVGAKKGAEDSAEAKRYIGSFALVGP